LKGKKNRLLDNSHEIVYQCGKSPLLL